MSCTAIPRTALQKTVCLILANDQRLSTNDFLPWTIPMHDLHAVSCLPQALADVFRNHDRAMLATGASERNRQITLTFPDVVGQEVNQQFGNPIDEFLSLRK